MELDMSDKYKVCIVCEESKDQVPLFKFKFKDSKYYICPTHLPVIIHKPHELEEKLPGITPSSQE